MNGGNAFCGDDVIESLAEKELNGREVKGDNRLLKAKPDPLQIRNVVLIALSMAEYENKPVDETLLNTICRNTGAVIGRYSLTTR
jgi:hypothetical protein